jgi:ribosomal protein S18 acetylase RimI-like enzyme
VVSADNPRILGLLPEADWTDGLPFRQEWELFVGNLGYISAFSFEILEKIFKLPQNIRQRITVVRSRGHIVGFARVAASLDDAYVLGHLEVGSNSHDLRVELENWCIQNAEELVNSGIRARSIQRALVLDDRVGLHICSRLGYSVVGEVNEMLLFPLQDFGRHNFKVTHTAPNGSWRSTYNLFVKEHTHLGPVSEDRWNFLMQASQSSIRVNIAACRDGIMAGIAIGRVGQEGDAELLYLAVSPSVERRGLGSSLLRAFVTESVLQGAKSIRVDVDRLRSPRAFRLYEAVGFSRVGGSRIVQVDLSKSERTDDVCEVRC